MNARQQLSPTAEQVSAVLAEIREVEREERDAYARRKLMLLMETLEHPVSARVCRHGNLIAYKGCDALNARSGGYHYIADWMDCKNPVLVCDSKEIGDGEWAALFAVIPDDGDE